MPATGKLNWGLLGTGRISEVFAHALAASATGALVAVGSRRQETADRFGAAWPGVRCHGSYEALLADPGVSAVYIALPHPMHAEWAIRAAEAGKHILCEKPLTLNHAEAVAVIEAARRHDVFLMEGFMYRCHPQIAKVRELIAAKALGEVRLIRASYGFRIPTFNPDSRMFSNALGGGGILDLGCYCVSLARLVAGAATQRAFAEPLDLSGTGVLASTGVDEMASATLRFPGDICAQLCCSIRLRQENDVTLFGTEGTLRIVRPWSPDGDPRLLELHRYKEKTTETIPVSADRPLFTIEADAVAASLRARQAPDMTWDDTLGNMQTLDRWRQAIGQSYDSEKA